MMRKVRYFLTLSFIMCFGLTNAQTYFPVTATSGTQVTGGITVNVSQSIPGPNTATQCTTGPYQIGKNYSDWYRYQFPNNVTHVRLKMIRIHDDDTIRICVNGFNNTYTLTGANLSNYAGGTCALTTTGMTTNGGLLSTTGGAVGAGQGVQVDIQVTPNVISDLRVIHNRSPQNIIASDVIYGLEVADDSCSLGFVATVDSPACSGRNLQLDVTQFPNTTYSWTSTAPLTPPWSPSSSVRNPLLVGVNQGHSGTYTVTATRGTCTYTTSVNVLVNQSPVTGQPIQSGPVCPGEDDTIKVPLVNLPTGGWVVAYGAWGRDTFDASQGYILRLADMTPGKAGLYNIYAAGIQGCLSDTNNFVVNIYDSVAAHFGWELKEGCEQDTVQFLDSTGGIGVNMYTWTFGDNSPSSNDKNPLHYYTVPKPHYNSRDYSVRLIATNGNCYDTSNQTLTINHPVKAGFRIDDDSICQGTQVVFEDADDSSYVKPGSTPTMVWYFGDGAFDNTNTFDADYTYNVAGIYEAKFVVTDFLGCADSFTRKIVVDSVGFVSFNTDKENICVGEEIKFIGDYSDYGYVSAIWDLKDGVTIEDSTEFFHSYTEPGTYDVSFDLTYRICPPEVYTGQIVVKPIPNVYLGKDTSICPGGEPVRIQDQALHTDPTAVRYSWNTPTKDVTPGISVRHHGVYSVEADLNGCTARDTVVVKKNCYINIPNAFTPNGDGNSDYFLPRQMLSKNITEFTMVIYNRWGEKVFESDVIDGRGWDGRYGGDPQPTGVYIYTMDVKFTNGYTERYQGNVTLLR